jgi:hypothetical protein
MSIQPKTSLVLATLLCLFILKSCSTDHKQQLGYFIYQEEQGVSTTTSKGDNATSSGTTSSLQDMMFSALAFISY